MADFVRRQIKRELRVEARPRLEEIFDALTKPIYRSYVNKQDLLVGRLALRRDFSLQSAETVYKKFWWTNLGWENMRPYSLAHFQRLIKRAAADKNLRGKIQHWQGYIQDNARLRQRYLREFKFSSQIKYYLLVCDEYMFYHDRRKEIQARTVYSARLILTEAARRFHYKLSDLEWIVPAELACLLQGQKFSLAEIRRRQQHVAIFVAHNKFEIFSGRAAKEIKDKNIVDQQLELSELRGQGVYGTLVSGCVKVCAGAAEALAKVKKGDILVCPMTLPDYVPAMKKAKAIITEEGGLTCYAAIVARELGIPCVVGVKGVNRILKDGDLIRVEANQGKIT